jgi:hypothetical protein
MDFAKRYQEMYILPPFQARLRPGLIFSFVLLSIANLVGVLGLGF